MYGLYKTKEIADKIQEVSEGQELDPGLGANNMPMPTKEGLNDFNKGTEFGIPHQNHYILEALEDADEITGFSDILKDFLVIVEQWRRDFITVVNAKLLIQAKQEEYSGVDQSTLDKAKEILSNIDLRLLLGPFMTNVENRVKQVQTQPKWEGGTKTEKLPTGETAGSFRPDEPEGHGSFMSDDQAKAGWEEDKRAPRITGIQDIKQFSDREGMAKYFGELFNKELFQKYANKNIVDIDRAYKEFMEHSISYIKGHKGEMESFDNYITGIKLR